MLHADLRVEIGDHRVAAVLDVAPHTVVALVGPNGAGKTTVLRALAGLLPLAAGIVRLGDRVLDDPGTRTWVPPEARRIGVVPQDLLLFDHLSVRENVAFGPRALGRRAGDARAAADALLARFGLSDLADRRPGELSGGQAQRVALARALATEPDALLLDEPLASLDVATRRRTRAELRTRIDEFGGPTVLVTHDPADARALADHVIVLEDGLVTQSGGLDDVASAPQSPYVAELFGNRHG